MPTLHRRRSAAAACAAVLALVAACRQPTEQQPGERTPTFTGRWAGQPWSGDAEAHLVRGGPAGDTLYVFGLRRPRGADSELGQSIRLRVVIGGPGVYPLAAEAVEVWDTVGGDVRTSTYVGLGPDAGVLHVDAYGGAGSAVEGTVHFEARSASPLAPYGPEPRFEDGRFRATVRPPR